MSYRKEWASVRSFSFVRGNFMAGSGKIVKLTEDLLQDFLRENGLSLYHTEFKREGKDWYLNVFIDKMPDENGQEQYVSSNDCEQVSRYLSERLDEKDPISQNYYLQVSSPGLDRQLYEQKDYDRYAGRLVDVRLYAAVNGSKEHQGTLVGCKDGKVVIRDEDGNEIAFPQDQVVKTCLAVVF
ncbi:MAG: ribosome maturation factor RimP [Eubacterium sp.]|jgi:ribosome maturation factor RimP|nr:ribosome maturation factor RimP [Eubacterium sp.]